MKVSRVNKLAVIKTVIVGWHVAVAVVTIDCYIGLSGWHAEECCEENIENGQSGRGHYEDSLQAGMLAAICCTELQLAAARHLHILVWKTTSL